MAEIYKVDASFDHGFFKGTSCAFGVFDGVHRGHRYLLDCARSTAAETGGARVALTFDIDPDEVFHPTRLKKLMTNEERVRMLADSCVDDVAVLPYTRDFAASTPEEFLVQTFDGTVPSFLHVGYDFKFGARAAGTVRDLDSWAAVGGTSVQAHDLKSDDGAAYAHVDGVRYKAAVNVGVAATFADRATATCEVHLLDFSGDLYGKPVKVEFLYWLRPMRKFDDLDELIATVKGNIAWVRENL